MRHRVIPSALVLVVSTALLIACGTGSVTTAPATPQIAGVEPASGGVEGGTPVVIRGENLMNPGVGANEVLIGGQPAVQITVVDNSTIRCITPKGAAGPAEVEVIKESGSGTLANGFTYHPAPTITSIDPVEGTRFGNTEVTVKGSGFLDNDPVKTVCMIGLKALVDAVIVDDETIVGKTPEAYFETTRDVTVLNHNGQCALPLAWKYKGPTPLPSLVTPDTGPRAGGIPVTIQGQHFTVSGGELLVFFGTGQAADVLRISDTELTCMTPPGPNGDSVDVKVENSNGPGVLEDGFYYLPGPEIEEVDPDHGWMTGGQPVTIRGDGFNSPDPSSTTVAFGSHYATDVVVVDNATITCTTPPGDMGPVNVTVANDQGSASKANGFLYTTPMYWDDTAGTTLSMSDESIQQISFAGSKIFPMYGANYTSCYICDNGHINLQYAYTQATPRFLLTVSPMINAWQASLNSSYGTTSYRQTADRFIVTFDDTPEYVNTGAIQVQVHMMWNGIIGILYDGQSSSLSEGPFVGIAPIVSAWPALVDLSSAQSADETETLCEQFTSPSNFDLDDGHLLFLPQAAGGYTSQWISGVPAAP